MSTDPERLVRFGPGSSARAPNERFGNKAACLARMASMGLPVPPGFALSIDVCRDYFANGRVVPPYLADHLRQGISYLESATGLRFGNPRRPLLVSVRSGSPVSMPGMMTTVLNVGISRETLPGLILRRGNPRFAWDSYRRLLENFGEVLGVDPAILEEALRSTMSSVGARDQSEMDFRALRDLASAYERVLRRVSGKPFPEEASEQLLLATKSVLDSWMSPRARQFRERNHLDHVGGTAVTIQAMVFGNLGRDSGAGVMFTRNPWNGENRPLIDFKLAVQGEDVVSRSRRTGRDDLERVFPDLLRDLTDIGGRLETEFGDMQDVEFTVEERRLFLLQTRSGSREPLAALRIALDLADEGRVGRDEARSRIAVLDLDRIVVHEMFSPREPLAQGEPASLGFATGAVAFSPAEAVEASHHGPVVLVKDDLVPDDLNALESAAGALMPRGSRTSHAIVVARQMGKTVVVNCPSVEVDPVARRFRVGETEVRAGDTITIDGATGRVYSGRVEFRTRPPESLLERARSLGVSAA
ncbi:MAG: PEP/pyruvate-binding domain-containing protein [Thermoplasmata archaeon]|jgi:pyruvate,orthophosphate dikinase